MTVISGGENKEQFTTGAQRDSQLGKGRPDLISPIFEDRLAAWLEAGGLKYGDRNWEKGIPQGRVLASLKRHIRAYQEGHRNEDHLAAAAFNVMVLLHTEAMVNRGLMPAELLDLPSYVKEAE
jgi:hypothetical protein